VPDESPVPDMPDVPELPLELLPVPAPDVPPYVESELRLLLEPGMLEDPLGVAPGFVVLDEPDRVPVVLEPAPTDPVLPVDCATAIPAQSVNVIALKTCFIFTSEKLIRTFTLVAEAGAGLS
jgi:hypothetical protein